MIVIQDEWVIDEDNLFNWDIFFNLFNDDEYYDIFSVK